MSKIRARLIIEGMVQGVFFRATMAEVAGGQGVRGWARNNPDGTVEAVLEGEEDRVEKVIQWSRTGPPRARVDRVDISREEFKDEFDGFTALTRHSVR